MILIPVLLVLLAAADRPEEAPPSPSGCWDKAETQADLNACAAADLADADREMNAVYKKLMETADPAFTTKVRAAQRAWLAFRDAHRDADFADPRRHGSSTPLCAANALAAMTNARTRQLRDLLEPAEGDVCGASAPEQAAKETPAPPAGPLFLVQFSTGPAWMADRPPHEQPRFREHGANLKRLRDAGAIALGARYADEGLVVLRRPSEAEARREMDADPGVQAGTFTFTLAELRPFFDGCVARSTAPVRSEPK